MKKYNFLNVWRLLMALCVVCNHLHPFDTFIVEGSLVYNLYYFVINLAVPFFFLSTGFFLGKKIKNINNLKSNDFSIIKKQLFKLLKIYIVFSLIYLPITIYGYVNYGTTILKVLFSYITIGENLNSWILWFVLSEIYAFLFIYVFRKKINNNKYYIIIGIILFLISLFINYFNGLVFSSNILILIQKCIRLVIPNGRILISLLYISLGIYISRNELINKKSLCIILLILLFIFNTFISNSFIMEISRVICSYIIFLFVLNADFKNDFISSYCRSSSKDIYFWHLFVFSIVQLIFERKIINILNIYRIKYFLITVFILFIVSSINYYKNYKKLNK